MRKTFHFLVGLIFCIFFIDKGLALLIEPFVGQIKYGQNVGRINYFLSKEDDTDILFMGNSRVRHHCIPDSFDVNTFVLAHDGMEFPFQVGLIAILKDKRKMPSKLLVQLEPYYFAGGGNKKAYEKDVQFLKYFYGKTPLVTSYINNISKTEKIKYIFSSYKYNGIIISLIRNYFKSKMNPPKYDGFESIEYVSEDSVSLNKQLAEDQYEELLNESTVDSTFLPYLNDLIGLCENLGTDLIFFTPPVYEDFLLRKRPKIATFLKTYLNDRGKTYWNYNEDLYLPELKDKKCWRDANHMNINGARIFTSDLKRRLNNIQ